jgi:uncharacterized membrane protein YeiB
MRTKTKNKIKAATPRLSDEEMDELEKGDSEGSSAEMIEAFYPWSPEDILDIKRLITERMPVKQRFILGAFLEGLTHLDINVTEKYWRYHFTKGVELIKKELKV